MANEQDGSTFTQQLQIQNAGAAYTGVNEDSGGEGVKVFGIEGRVGT